MVGKGDSQKRSGKDKENHLALVKYLEKDITENSGPLQAKDNADVDHLAEHDGDEMFVWPWKGIVVNLPIELKDGRYVGKSGSNLRDTLTMRGFNPTRVIPLWNFHGHSGSAVVEFKKDCMGGIQQCMSFEKAYEADHHGKWDWKVNKDDLKDEIYGWVARSDDYNATTIIGEHLRKIGDLKTIYDIMAEEDRKVDSLESNLKNIMEVKEKQLEEMENKYVETEHSVMKLISEKDQLLQHFIMRSRKLSRVHENISRRSLMTMQRLKRSWKTKRENSSFKAKNYKSVMRLTKLNKKS